MKSSFIYLYVKDIGRKKSIQFLKRSTKLYVNPCARVLEFDGKRSNLLPYFFISSYLPKNMDYIWIVLIPIILFQLVGPRSPQSMLFCLRTYRYPVRRSVYQTRKPSSVDVNGAIVLMSRQNKC